MIKLLIELKIENFALIECAEINFGEGLNVLTGESGSGKSLVVDALNFVVGGRIKSSRFNRKRARVQAIFDIKKIPHEIIKDLRENSLLEDEDEYIILMRKFYPSGRNVYQINGQIVPLKLYRKVGSNLVDIHSQRDTSTLLVRENQRKILDKACGEKAEVILKELQRLYKKYSSIALEIESIKRSQRERNRQIDWLKFEIKEIEDANLYVGEEEELTKQKNILSNAEVILKLSSSIYEILSGDLGVLEKLGEVSKYLSQWGEYDEDVLDLEKTLESIISSLQEISFQCREKGEGIEFNPESLDEVMNRLYKIESLKKKYGSSIEDILQYRQRAEDKLKTLQAGTQKVEELEKEREKIREEWYRQAQLLSNIRRKRARVLENEIMKELKDLGMDGAIFEIKLSTTQKASINPYGLDNIEFLVSTNAGLPKGPLSTVASGGEVSRIMLALKNVFAQYQNYTTLVLDEIDVGIGGDTADVVSRKLKGISKHRQVICVTHLPIIAAKADMHYHIEKEAVKDMVKTVLKPVVGKNRIDEVARMIGGKSTNGEMRKVAQKMIETKG